jgi:UDP-N-acetylmuramate: L-alanyl-gamma-D-glutamyl-meso-diaminopimelate ligase
MRKVHLISVTEPLVLDLALALREKGYEVSASGCGLTEEMIGRLHNAGCTCYGDGWFPEKLIKDIHSVVLGAKVKQDNPELLRAKELGMLIQSIPEFILRVEALKYIDLMNCLRKSPESRSTVPKIRRRR